MTTELFSDKKEKVTSLSYIFTMEKLAVNVIFGE